MKDAKYSYELDNNRLKDFLLSFINTVIIIAASFAIYFSVFFPISKTQYGKDRSNVEETSQTLFDIGYESKLYHGDKDKKETYSLTSSYRYYVRTLLRYDYENSDYDLEKDPDNFKLKKDEIDLFPEIKDFDDDFFGYFYVTYCFSNNLVNYQGKEPIEYFKYEILNIDDENGGGKFFVDGVSYPHLKSDVRTALYNYVVLSATNKAYGNVDKEFFAYFTNLYEESGNVLLTYLPYKEAYDLYSYSYNRIHNFNKLAIYVSFFISLIIVAIIVPLCNKHKQNIAQLILKRVDLSKNEETKPRIFITRFFYDLLRYFPAIVIFAFAISQEILFEGMFYIGFIPISLFVLASIVFIIDIVSIMIGMIRKDTRNLCALISDSDNYSITREL